MGRNIKRPHRELSIIDTQSIRSDSSDFRIYFHITKG